VKLIFVTNRKSSGMSSEQYVSFAAMCDCLPVSVLQYCFIS